MRDYIFKRIAAIFVPFICIFGFYVILHGASSAGGSFAGGIILGLAFIVYATVYGVEEGKSKLPSKVLNLVESYGTLFYVLVGLVGVFRGAPFLSNKLAGISLGRPGSIFSGGLISILGIGVGIRVANTMITLFFTMKGEES